MAKIGKMFWLGCGPRDPETALACSVAHDKHNIWVVGSSDAAMAMAVNVLVELQGGWAWCATAASPPRCATRSAA